jgi:hypothetical protein
MSPIRNQLSGIDVLCKWKAERVEVTIKVRLPLPLSGTSSSPGPVPYINVRCVRCIPAFHLHYVVIYEEN